MRLHFGGDVDQDQSSKTENISTTNTTDRRAVADGQGVIVGDGGFANVSNSVTDFGSVKAGTDLAQAAIVGLTKLATEQSAKAGQLAVSSIEATGNVVTELKGAYASANEQAQAVASGNKTLAIVGMIVAGILAVAYFNESKKK